MEGLGYWIFLAVMYLLSALMKKRQRQEPAVNDSDTQSEKKTNPFQAEFLQNLFGDMKEFVREPESEMSEELSDFDIDDIGLEQSSEPIPSPEHEEQNLVVFENLPKLAQEPLHKKHKFSKAMEKSKLSFKPQFKNMEDIKRAIVLKEILDKPRAIRRAIR